MWFLNERDELEFSAGKNNPSKAALEAQNCSKFKLDDEDEIVDDAPVSCYNCRYRRWTESSIVCCKRS